MDKIEYSDGIKDTKKKILNSLEGGFEVTKVERVDWDSGISIICEFINKGKTGKFEYTLEGGERGVDSISDYEEEDDEDIYGEIHKWIGDNINWWTTIKWGDKEIG